MEGQGRRRSSSRGRSGSSGPGAAYGEPDYVDVHEFETPRYRSSSSSARMRASSASRRMYDEDEDEGPFTSAASGKKGGRSGGKGPGAGARGSAYAREEMDDLVDSYQVAGNLRDNAAQHSRSTTAAYEAPVYRTRAGSYTLDADGPSFSPQPADEARPMDSHRETTPDLANLQLAESEYDQFLQRYLTKKEKVVNVAMVKKQGGFGVGGKSKRLLALTDFPRVFYVDVRNGSARSISLTPDTYYEQHSFNKFDIHTEDRVYEFDVEEGNARGWVSNLSKAKDDLEEMGDSIKATLSGGDDLMMFGPVLVETTAKPPVKRKMVMAVIRSQSEGGKTVLLNHVSYKVEETISSDGDTIQELGDQLFSVLTVDSRELNIQDFNRSAEDWINTIGGMSLFSWQNKVSQKSDVRDAVGDLNFPTPKAMMDDEDDSPSSQRSAPKPFKRQYSKTFAVGEKPAVVERRRSRSGSSSLNGSRDVVSHRYSEPPIPNPSTLSRKSIVKSRRLSDTVPARYPVDDNKFQAGLVKFNTEGAKKGIKYLVDRGYIQENPYAIAHFLHTERDILSKSKIGDYLGEPSEKFLAVLNAFVTFFDFRNQDIDAAIRALLKTFQLPGEAQKIDRIMNAFAQHFCKQNPGIFSSPDVAYVLAYSIIMLHTDAHNPSVKNKMTKEGFIRNNSGINDGKDLPQDFLGALYDRVTTEEMKMNSDSLDEHLLLLPEKRGLLLKEGGKYKTWRSRWFILSSDSLYYFRSEEETKPLGMVPLENVKVRAKHGGKGYSFELYNPTSGRVKSCKAGKDGGFETGNHDSFVMAAETEQDRQEWMDAIGSNVSKDSFYELLTRKKDQVMNKSKPHTYVHNQSSAGDEFYNAQLKKFCYATENIVRGGDLNKKKFLGVNLRHFVLTDFPRLFYIDPKKPGVQHPIAFTPDIHAERTGTATFKLKTKDRLYDFEDPHGPTAQDWCHAINTTREALRNSINQVAERLLEKEKGEVIRLTSVVTKMKVKTDGQGNMSNKRRLLVLTSLPRLFFVNLDGLKYNGDVPLSPRYPPEVWKTDVLLLHTTANDVYVRDTSVQAQDWVRAIQPVWHHIAGTQLSSQMAATTAAEINNLQSSNAATNNNRSDSHKQQQGRKVRYRYETSDDEDSYGARYYDEDMDSDEYSDGDDDVVYNYYDRYSEEEEEDEEDFPPSRRIGKRYQKAAPSPRTRPTTRTGSVEITTRSYRDLSSEPLSKTDKRMVTVYESTEDDITEGYSDEEREYGGSLSHSRSNGHGKKPLKSSPLRFSEVPEDDVWDEHQVQQHPRTAQRHTSRGEMNWGKLKSRALVIKRNHYKDNPNKAVTVEERRHVYHNDDDYEETSTGSEGESELGYSYGNARSKNRQHVPRLRMSRLYK